MWLIDTDHRLQTLIIFLWFTGGPRAVILRLKAEKCAKNLSDDKMWLNDTDQRYALQVQMALQLFPVRCQ